MGGWRSHPNNPNRAAGRKKATEWWQFKLPPLESNLEPVRQSPPRTRSPPVEWWSIEAKPTTLTDWHAPPPTPPKIPKESALVRQEEWKMHPFWKVYVSTYGRVQLPRGSKSFGSPNQRGYMRVSLKHPMKKTYVKVAVHRLVIEAHVPSRIYRRIKANGFVVNHKDNDPTNNWFTNLEFITAQANSQHYWDKVYPDRKRQECVMDIVNNRSTRPIWIADEQGRVRQANRRINIYNDVDRAWLQENMWWDDIKEIIGE